MLSLDVAEPSDVASSRSMTSAVSHQARRHYLDALDVRRRQLRLRLVSDRLLRKPDNAKQGKVMERLATELRGQVRDQMGRRRRFRGPVAMTIELHATSLDQPPGTPPSVKAYVDVLQGLVYRDDRDVHLLRVARNASDNPIVRASDRSWIWSGEMPRFPHGPEEGVAVAITVWPVRLYASLYDAMWLNQSEIFDDARFGDAAGAAFFGTDIVADDQARDELDELLAEEAAEYEGSGALYGPGGLFADDAEGRALRAESAALRREQIRGLRNRQLLRQRPTIADRPGPARLPARIE